MHGRNSRYYQGPGQIEQFLTVDVDNVRLVIEGSFFPGASDLNRAALRVLLASIRIHR